MLFAVVGELLGQKIPDGFYNRLRLYVMFLVEGYLRLAAAFRLLHRERHAVRYHVGVEYDLARAVARGAAYLCISER